jgi:hypothetical protein
MEHKVDCAELLRIGFYIYIGIDIGSWSDGALYDSDGQTIGDDYDDLKDVPVLSAILYKTSKKKKTGHAAAKINDYQIIQSGASEHKKKVGISDLYWGKGKYRIVAIRRFLSDKQIDALTVKEDNPVPEAKHNIEYSVHVQNIGDQSIKRNGQIAGTTGRSLRMEALKIDIPEAPNSVEYRGHVQDIGWLDSVEAGKVAGTKGKSLRLEAVEIRLKGDMASKYDIYYRLHVQNIGWMGWARNGQPAGTVGMSLRGEAIQIVLVEKGGSAPGSTADAFRR